MDICDNSVTSPWNRLFSKFHQSQLLVDMGVDLVFQLLQIIAQTQVQLAKTEEEKKCN